MKRLLNYLITKQDDQKTIELYLREKGYSKSVLIHLRKSENGILLNNLPAYTTRHVLTGDSLTISLIEETTSANILPVSMELSILYEDEDLMVINKAADMPVHPSQGNFDNTLANAVAWYFHVQNKAFVFRAVNRLDRDTTGLLIIAKNMLSAAILSTMTAQKEIVRTYLAIALGETDLSGTICKPIARVDGSTIERCIDEEKGEYACTHYKRLTYDAKKDCSLLLLTLETGRTHQIRVHMKSINHPLLGDFLYNPDYRYINRQSLHSYRLSFRHPITGASMDFEAPIPKDFYFMPTS